MCKVFSVLIYNLFSFLRVRLNYLELIYKIISLTSTVRNVSRLVMRIYMLIYMLKGYGNEHAKFSAKLNVICQFTSVLCRGESVSVTFVISFYILANLRERIYGKK